jgi:hypothetical protein
MAKAGAHPAAIHRNQHRSLISGPKTRSSLHLKKNKTGTYTVAGRESRTIVLGRAPRRSGESGGVFDADYQPHAGRRERDSDLVLIAIDRKDASPPQLAALAFEVVHIRRYVDAQPRRRFARYMLAHTGQ